MKVRDLTGKKFGRLTVVERAKRDSPKAYWMCKCDCGNEHVVCGTNLTRGKVVSCGCYAKEKRSSDKTTHGGSYTRLYVTINGETHTLSQWCEIKGINYYTVMARRRSGWSNEKAVSIPINARRKRG